MPLNNTSLLADHRGILRLKIPAQLKVSMKRDSNRVLIIFLYTLIYLCTYKTHISRMCALPNKPGKILTTRQNTRYQSTTYYLV